MQSRIDYSKASPDARTAMGNLEVFVRSKSGLEQSLLDLVYIRASFLNECAYCIDVHIKDALTHGETMQRLYELAAWEEAPFYTERERAALAWTDAVTLINENHVPDEVFNWAREYFSEKELVDLTMAIITINGWNRLVISFRKVPGTGQPGMLSQQKAAEKPVDVLP